MIGTTNRINKKTFGKEGQVFIYEVERKYQSASQFVVQPIKKILHPEGAKWDLLRNTVFQGEGITDHKVVKFIFEDLQGRL